MKSVIKKVTAGALAFALILGCGGCGSAEPEVTELQEPKPTIHNAPFEPVSGDG